MQANGVFLDSRVHSLGASFRYKMKTSGLLVKILGWKKKFCGRNIRGRELYFQAHLPPLRVKMRIVRNTEGTFYDKSLDGSDRSVSWGSEEGQGCIPD